MTEQRYVIDARDVITIRQYIHKKLQVDLSWELPLEAHRAFEQQVCDAITLSQWCQQWLNPEQWQRLQSALRASRYRQRVRRKPSHYGVHVHMRLTYQAWSILTQLAKRDGLTVSEFVVQQHQGAYAQWFEQQP